MPMWTATRSARWFDDALPSDADPHRTRGYVYIAEVAAVRGSTRREQDLFAYPEPEKPTSCAVSKRRNIRSSARRSGRERPRDDVADDDEPRQPPPDQVLPTDAERTSAVFDLLLGDNLQGRKEHSPSTARSIWTRSGRELIRARRRTPLRLPRVWGGACPARNLP